ncbi:MAG: UxaA family hydrolase [Alphaproteobacteria bacterium]|jgi:hypothetical protein
MTAETTDQTTDPRLILLAPEDNVLIVGATLKLGETVQIEGQTITCPRRTGLGHKLARRDLAVGEVVLKYGAPIGSMTEAAAVGAHVHLHNLKSDYIPTYTHANQTAYTEASA